MEKLWDILGDLTPGQLRAQHIPSHLDPLLCENAFEEWVAEWNGHADTVATLTNASRSSDTQRIAAEAIRYFTDTAACIRALRAIYLQIAEISNSDRRTVNPMTLRCPPSPTSICP